MESRYDIKEVETRIYAAWEKSGFFNPDVCVEKGATRAEAEPFSVVLPPPNVTGTLHIGHAFEDTVQDVVIRYERMKGKRTLWVPGTDHAAIATQSKVEKELAKEGIKKHDLGREAFLRRVEAFAQESHDTIVRQVKRIGASLDWSREAYTLDAQRSLAVRTAFERMYDLGLIYRGDRVVNWDPKGQTVISDDEVVYEERKAKLYTFRYTEGFPIPISTTRPETKVGDTAVAVHPTDERYKKYIGQEFEVNFCGVPLLIKVIADESVEPEFGTGALGVTPAHSMIDWEMAQKHGLPLVTVIDEHARMKIASAPESPLNGLKTTEARERIVEALSVEGLLEKEEEITQNISIAERTGGVIEPLPKLQWFIGVNKKFKAPNAKKEATLKELMHDAVASGKVKILPDRFEKIYYHWIENLRDWCISRQIWFGHRIPVWYCMNCGEPHVNAETRSKWFLIRHGESKLNQEKRSQGQLEGNPLTALGVAQVEQAAEQFKNEKIDLIISSDLERCKMTAEIIAKATGAELILDKRLRERHLGEAEGITREERKAKYGDMMWDYDKTIPGGETWIEVDKRLRESVDEHLSHHKYKNVVIVTHGSPIKLILGKMQGIDGKDVARETYPQNANVTPITISISCSKCGQDFYEQDPDTLDTWFSSGLWPFSTLGWPDMDAPDLKTYFPNAFMGPGYEILFFWVARMILMSGALLGEIPFRTVYLHGIVRDAKGEKFSKSKGNGIDPLVLADTYGADALRMALIVGAAPGNDVKFDEQRVKGYRNFATKIWNIARFIEMNRPVTNGGGNADGADPNATGAHTHTEHAYLKEFAALKTEVTTHLNDYDFHLAAEKTYHYIWHTLADQIIEAEKPKLREGNAEEKATSYALLEYLLLESLKMLHPFMPFITEEIFQIFRPGKMLMVERWE
jgi:valyl-tRNA synthetase